MVYFSFLLFNNYYEEVVMTTDAQKPERPVLNATIAAIRKAVTIPPQAYTVGDVHNSADENQGALTILIFAITMDLDVKTTLMLFAEAYAECLENPDGTDHVNVRALMLLDPDTDIVSNINMSLSYHALQNTQALIDIAPRIIIEAAFEFRKNINPDNASQYVRCAVDEVIGLLNDGELRVSEKINGEWVTNQWLKKAILLVFRINHNKVYELGDVRGYDKLPSRFNAFTDAGDFAAMGVRVVPGATARYGAYVAPEVILMASSFVNIGAYVDRNTMVDTGARIGSCAHVGKNCHISGGAGIGGVLEPLQANPTIIGDNCFIGANSEIAEGVIVEDGCVIGMGCCIGQSTPIINRATGEVVFGRIPPYSVVIPGTIPVENSGYPGLAKPCVIIMKTVDERTRSKTGINDLLRD